ncbi:PEP-CTERM sorting domain-containing protein [Paucibacter sp. Y2R2-4]|uniref:PEP-CTERM sorting domain-containing protein n=1 Tax=Paucibacter sp. Y2R2-4 TaxID=2893553 RepID=UPI0021E47C84|nr:PEP-CTERM sorting domain-containing protein [Paucibacter sp. Y2R2-4]MCV2348949.1 PEP-CTERM sorting domain-containing protein [Paucibacter sp. Y2R2-4]
MLLEFVPCALQTSSPQLTMNFEPMETPSIMTPKAFAKNSPASPRRIQARNLGPAFSAIALAALTLVGASAPAQAWQVTWLGGSGDWYEASNWGYGSAPSFWDLAFIEQPPEMGTVVRLSAPDVVTQIQGLRVGPGNVLELGSHLLLSGGGWSSEPPLINKGDIHVKGGTLSLGYGNSNNSQGNITFSAGGSLSFQAWNDASLSGGSLISDGQVTSLYGSQNSVLRDLTLQGSFSVVGDSRIALAGQIVNQGQLLFAADPANRGGQLALAGDTTLSGQGKTIVADFDGSTYWNLITPGGGFTLTIDTGHTLEARGLVTLGAGDLPLINRGTILLTPAASDIGAVLTLDPGRNARIDNSSGVIDLNSSALGNFSGGPLWLLSGELRGGTLKVGRNSAIFTATGSVLRDVRIDGNATTGYHQQSLNLAGKITLGTGHQQWSGDDASLLASDNGPISLAADTEFANDPATGGRGYVLLSGWSNQRALVKGNGHHLLISGELWSLGGQLGQGDISVHNTGHINVGHELSIQASPDEGLTNDGLISLGHGETNAIDGTMRPYWSNLALDGTLMLGHDSMLGVSVSPGAAGLQSGLLAVTGDVTLDGNVAFTVDGAPSDSEVTFLTFSGVRFGQFSSANAYASDWTTGIRYNVAIIYGDHSVSAKFTSAVPEPQSWVLMLGGIGLLGWLRKQSHSGRKELA